MIAKLKRPLLRILNPFAIALFSLTSCSSKYDSGFLAIVPFQRLHYGMTYIDRIQKPYFVNSKEELYQAVTRFFRPYDTPAIERIYDSLLESFPDGEKTFRSLSLIIVPAINPSEESCQLYSLENVTWNELSSTITFSYPYSSKNEEAFYTRTNPISFVLSSKKIMRSNPEFEYKYHNIKDNIGDLY